MSKDLTKSNIREFIIKEDERYRLTKLGFFSDLEEEVTFIAENFPVKGKESFYEWKTRILDDFYRRKDFNGFCKENRGNEFFERGVKSLLTADLYEMFLSNEKSETDRYLALEGETISYSLSPTLFQTIYGEHFSVSVSWDTSKLLDKYCKEVLRSRFPLPAEYVIEELKGNNNFYWERVFTRLKPLTAGFSYQISGSASRDSVLDLWSDTCYILNQAVVGGKLKQPTLVQDIISYAVGIIKNKNKELLRGRKRAPQTDLDSITYKLTADDEKRFFDDPATIPANFPSQEEKLTNYIDLADEESVRNYMIVVLYNEEHPLHKKLVEGLEEKVKLLFEHYLDDLSYEEMVTKRYGEVDEKDMVRHAARFRQDVKRIKERLINRFEVIITEPKNA